MGDAKWLRTSRYSALDDFGLYIDNNPVGWVEWEELTTNGGRDPLLPEEVKDIEGTKVVDYRRGWYGWQVGQVDEVLAAGVAPTLEAAKACVEQVATLCGFLGYDNVSGKALWSVSDG